MRQGVCYISEYILSGARMSIYSLKASTALLMIIILFSCKGCISIPIQGIEMQPAGTMMSTTIHLTYSAVSDMLLLDHISILL